MESYLDIDPRIRCDAKDLLDKPIVITVNKFEVDAVRKFREQFVTAHQIRQPIIPVLIDSYGGEVYSLMGMITVIKNSQIPVATVIDSKAMSCGAILFSFGSEGHRYMSEDATIMIHHVSLGAYGNTTAVDADAAQGRLLNKKVYKMMAKNCGHGKNYFIDLVEKHNKNVDWYLTAKEALKHNLATELKIPKLRTRVQVNIDFN